jgi:serine/threonine protein kinase
MSESQIDTELNSSAPPVRRSQGVAPSSHGSYANEAGGWVPPTPEELGEMIPLYRIDCRLGRGGMGVVYKAWQPALERAVAIKLLPADLAANQDFLLRFQREARTLARLQHPGIVTVYDFGQTPDGHLYFVMEYVDGTDLRQVLDTTRLTAVETCDLIAQICDALHYAHLEGVIHRDIKPANILINKAGRAKVVDFGLARPLDVDLSEVTQAGACMGTPAYMAPEQRIDAGKADQRADIFALGMVLYEMLTGRRPDTWPATPPSEKAEVDGSLDAVVLKALEFEPARRYGDVREMWTEVYRVRTQILNPVPVAPVELSAPGPPRGWRRTKLRIAALVLVVGGIGAFAIWRGHARSAATAAHAKLTPAPAPPAAVVAQAAAATPVAEKAPAPIPPPATPAPVVYTPKPTPLPATPTPPSSDDPVVFETILRSYSWVNKNGWIMRFENNNTASVKEGTSNFTYHWWIVGTRTLHVQFAAMPAKFDPKIGGTWLFDPSVSSFRSVAGGDATGTREHFLPLVARQLAQVPPTPSFAPRPPIGLLDKARKKR